MAAVNQGVAGDGFYWYFEDDGDANPVIVKVSGMEVSFCGLEAYFFLLASGEEEYTLTGRFVGPLLPPANADQ